uniref:Secreted protein n=1 Tax=Haemonchus contortus TaxID=6289 RepID=A0A7I4YKR1_HAECO
IIRMLLFLLFLNCFLANIATEDIKATLAPLYKQFEDWCVNGRVESAVNLYHSQGVNSKHGSKRYIWKTKYHAKVQCDVADTWPAHI